MPLNIEQPLHLYRKQLEPVLNGHMKRMILYGSYARGDFKRDSDIDVMILLDLDGPALLSCEKKSAMSHMILIQSTGLILCLWCRISAILTIGKRHICFTTM